MNKPGDKLDSRMSGFKDWFKTIGIGKGFKNKKVDLPIEKAGEAWSGIKLNSPTPEESAQARKASSTSLLSRQASTVNLKEVPERKRADTVSRETQPAVNSSEQVVVSQEELVKEVQNEEKDVQRGLKFTEFNETERKDLARESVESLDIKKNLKDDFILWIQDRGHIKHEEAVKSGCAYQDALLRSFVCNTQLLDHKKMREEAIVVAMDPYRKDFETMWNATMDKAAISEPVSLPQSQQPTRVILEPEFKNTAEDQQVGRVGFGAYEVKRPPQVEMTSTKSVTQESALEPKMFTRDAVYAKLSGVDERLRDAFVKAVDTLLGTEESFKTLQVDAQRQKKPLKEVVWEKYQKLPVDKSLPQIGKGAFDALWKMVTSKSGK